MSSNKKGTNLFKEPNIFVQTMGKLTFRATLSCPKNLRATCIAMESLAKAENRDDITKRSGIDDYSLSFGKLFNAFDTFIKEHSNKKKSAGIMKNYDLSDPCEFTIILLWQIRNVWTHHGGLVDKNCKTKYEAVHNKNIVGIKTIIDLPQELEIGQEFTIKFDDYKIVKSCILNYIGKRVSEEDLKILSTRSSISNFKFEECLASLPLDSGSLVFDLVEAYDCGCEIDPITCEFKTPSEAKYDIKKELVILSNGKSFPAKLVKRH